MDVPVPERLDPASTSNLPLFLARKGDREAIEPPTTPGNDYDLSTPFFTSSIECPESFNGQRQWWATVGGSASATKGRVCDVHHHITHLGWAREALST